MHDDPPSDGDHAEDEPAELTAGPTAAAPPARKERRELPDRWAYSIMALLIVGSLVGIVVAVMLASTGGDRTSEVLPEYVDRLEPTSGSHILSQSTVGVDVTPLLAGAGVIGLAVSLGSQTLVKDIVAGIFYMMDDVFRLGETIEAGAYSGVIEQIKLRSIRVRGRDGRLHTIPLGELGAVTNLSRKLSPVTIRVGADSPPDRYVAEQFRNRLWSALQSEPAIRAGITGEMTQVAPDSDSGGATLGFRLSMVDGAARQHRERMRFLVEEIIDEPDSAGLRRPVDIEVDEAAAAQPVPA